MAGFAVSTKFTVVLLPATLLRKPDPVIVMDVPPAADPMVDVVPHRWLVTMLVDGRDHRLVGELRLAPRLRSTRSGWTR